MSSSRWGSFNRPSPFGGFRFFPPVIKFLLLSNVTTWLLTNVLMAPMHLDGVPLLKITLELFALWPLGEGFLPWQLGTYMFLHDGFGHLFFNMLALWMFGMELENMWGTKKFITYYLLCGVGGALSNLLFAPMLGQVAPTIGASGAVFGVLIAFGMMYPDRPIYLYFLLPIRAKYFITAYVALELIHGIFGTAARIAYFAHLGGAAVGFVYMLGERGVLPLRGLWYRFRTTIQNPFASGDRVFRKEEKEPVVYEAKFYDIGTGRPRKDEKETTQEIVDAILDKIAKGGYQNLTEDEKRVLNDASKKIH